MYPIVTSSSNKYNKSITIWIISIYNCCFLLQDRIFVTDSNNVRQGEWVQIHIVSIVHGLDIYYSMKGIPCMIWEEVNKPWGPFVNFVKQPSQIHNHTSLMLYQIINLRLVEEWLCRGSSSDTTANKINPYYLIG